jgi:(3,5-dihydroxyphenyl)acetyl-CoA 1,2-dioxygenase
MQTQQEAAILANAGLPADAAQAWRDSCPEITGDFARDARHFSAFWLEGAGLRAKLPEKPRRNEAQAAAGKLIFETERAARAQFLAAHVEHVYDKLTNDRRNFVRAETLVYDAAKAFPGLTPTHEMVARDDAKMLAEKDGFEIDQGLFLSQVLGHPRTGRHLMHAMLLPRAETAEYLPQFLKRGEIDLGAAKVFRIGKAAVLEMRNPRFLNAMDDSTNDPIEIATDIVVLDPETMIAVLRGGPVENPKYAGKRLFSAGINLTLLYQGRISFLFYIRHLLGFENKWLRGLARPEFSPDERVGQTIEKPWIAAVDGFAIGGGCQHLLVMDYILAASDAYMTLPARKEGIIPGASNMRLPRFVGDRIARQAIMYGRQLTCDSPEGRLICDEIVPPDQMDAALKRVIEGLTSSGVVSAVANRRAFRIAQEPIDMFLNYASLYAREQAYCHFSPALIANLERHWNAQNRKV